MRFARTCFTFGLLIAFFVAYASALAQEPSLPAWMDKLKLSDQQDQQVRSI